LDNILARIQPNYTDQIPLWIVTPIASRGASIVRPSHSPAGCAKGLTGLSYVYYLARSLADRKPDEVADHVLEHLVEAQETICSAWGFAEFNRLGDISLADFEENVRLQFIEALDLKEDTLLQNLTLKQLGFRTSQHNRWQVGAESALERLSPIVARSNYPSFGLTI